MTVPGTNRARAWVTVRVESTYGIHREGAHARVSQLRAELAALESAFGRAAVQEVPLPRTKRGTRKMSKEGQAKIAAAAKAR